MDGAARGDDSAHLLASFSVLPLRAFRVLRSLRVVQGLPSLQLVIKSISKSMLKLAHVGILVTCIIVLYAIVGLEFFRGGLDSACFYIATGDQVDERPCVPHGDGRISLGTLHSDRSALSAGRSSVSSRLGL